MSERKCHACGGSIPLEAIFCPICGFRQKKISAADHKRLTAELVAARASSPDLAAEAGGNGDGQRRAAPRFPLCVDVDYTSDHNFYTGFMENISSGGVFIATHEPVGLGEELEVTFTVPGLDGVCVVVCRVRWSRDYNPDTPEFPPGIGCQFLDLHPEAAAAISLFIKHRDPIFFD